MHLINQIGIIDIHVWCRLGKLVYTNQLIDTKDLHFAILFAINKRYATRYS